MVSKKQSGFIKDVVVTFLGQIIVLVTNFLINKMIAIFVGVSAFGIFNITKRSATVIGFIILLELGISIPRYFAMNLKKDKLLAYEYYESGLYLIIIVSIIAIVISFFCSDMLTKMLFGSMKYKNLIMPMMVFSIGLCFNTFCFSAYRGAEYFYLYSGIQITTQVVNMLVIYILRHNGIAEIILGWGISNIILTIPLVMFFSKLCNIFIFIKIRKFKKRTFELLKYGIPRIPGDIVQFSYYLLPLVFVNARFGQINSGLFSASTGILQAFLPFFSYIGIILLPRVSKAIVDGTLENVKKQIKVLMIIYLFFSVLAVVVGFVFAKYIMIILYSEKYTAHLIIARILLLTLIPRSQFLLLRNPIDAVTVKPFNTVNLVISMTVMIVIIVFSNSMYAIAWSFVISDTLLFLFSYATWNKLIREKENGK